MKPWIWERNMGRDLRESGWRNKDREKLCDSILLLKVETKEELWNEKVFPNCRSDEELVFKVNLTRWVTNTVNSDSPAAELAGNGRLLLLSHCFYCFGFTFDVTIPKWQFRVLSYLLFIFKQENQILCYCYIVIQGIFPLVLMNIF